MCRCKRSKHYLLKQFKRWFGGGREGVQRASINHNDRNRAALQAQLLGQGFAQAQNLAADFSRNLTLAQQPCIIRTTDFSTTGWCSKGREQQLTAQQQFYKTSFTRFKCTQQFGSGVTITIAGYPGREKFNQLPAPSPLATGLELLLH